MQRILLTLVCCLLSLSAFAINPIVNYAIFNLPEKGCYVETYLMIPGSSVTFAKNEAKQLQAGVEITMLFKQGEDIIKFDKYILNSPIVTKKETVDFNLIDLKRNALKDGIYELEISLKDIHNPANNAQFKETLEIRQKKAEIWMSDIVLIEQYKPTEKENEYSKNGYDLVPNVLNYYPQKLNKLAFYTEIYNTSQLLEDPSYLTVYSVKYSGTNRVAKELRSFKKQKATDVNVLFAEIDISDLASGNYDLIVEVRNRKNELKASQMVLFQRSNSSDIDIEDISQVDITETFAEHLSEEEVVFYVKSLRPISDPQEQLHIDNIADSKEKTYQRQFLYNYWASKSPLNPQEGFTAYKQAVDFVEKKYKTSISHGFQTDRGITYLKYGAPNGVQEVKSEPGTLPHEVWQYYKIENGQTNIKFVFLNRAIAGNDYELIHSNARGEIADNRWQMRVSNGFRAVNGGTDIDKQTTEDYYGKRLGDDF